MNGVSISEKEFKNMSTKDQNGILFKNTSQIIEGMKEHISLFEKHLKDDKFNFKTIRWMIVGLGLLVGLGKYFNLI